MNAKPTILIADKWITWANLFSDLLSQDYDVTSVGSLSEAKNQIKKRNSPFRVAVIDIQFTENPAHDLISGSHSVLDEIQNQGSHIKPIVAISHGPTEQQIKKLLKAYNIAEKYCIEKFPKGKQSFDYKRFKQLVKNTLKEEQKPMIPAQEHNSNPFHALSQKIVSFLTSIPNIDDKDAQRALIQGAGLDAQLRNQISFGGPPAQFFQLLITTLHSYGRLEDGRNPIVAVLEAAKNSVGPNKRTYCEELVQELYVVLGEKPKRAKTQHPETPQIKQTTSQTELADVEQAKSEVLPQTITWLHLSDFHFRASQTYNANIVLKELLKDVSERITQDTLSPDFIIVTGDIAFSSKQEEYELAKQFLDNLLNATSLSREKLFLVPGNHDVDRNQITITAKALGEHLTDRDRTNTLLGDSGEFRAIMKRFEKYAEFVSNYWGGRRAFDETRYFEVHKVNIAGRQIALLALNSAWLCASDQDKTDGLLLGERQVRAALDQARDAELKIALLHHPFDWLREFDQNDSATLLTDRCNFILRGHLHRSEMFHLSSPDSSAMVIACGACYETREHPNSYNFVRLDVKTGEGVVYLRRYSDERGGFWAKDTLTYRNVPDGEYQFKYI